MFHYLNRLAAKMLTRSTKKSSAKKISTTTKPPKYAPSRRNITDIFVHATAQHQHKTVEDTLKIFKNKGWKAPGYHFIVPADGTRHYVWHIDKVANGVKGKNANAIHVSYIGGLYEDDRTEAQKEELLSILRDLKKVHPYARIRGHREIWGDNPALWKKACPRFDVQPWLIQNGL